MGDAAGDSVRLAVLAGSGSPWAYATLEALHDAGAELHVIHVPPEPGQAYIDLNAPAWRGRIDELRSLAASYHALDPGSGFSRWWNVSRALRSILREVNAEHLLCLYGGGLALAAKLSGFHPYSVYLVGSDVRRGHPVKMQVARWALSSASLLVANGDDLARQAEAVAGRPVRPLLLGIDTDRYRPAPEPSDLGERPYRFLAPRGFAPVYNNQQILEALAQLPEEGPDWEITFAAGGDLLADARAWASEHLPASMQQRITFSGGMSSDGLLQAMQSHDAMISVALRDGTATTLLEALAVGMVPILSDIPANRPWVREGLGALVPVADPATLAEAMHQARIRGPLTEAMRQELRAPMLKLADSRSNMRTLLDLLQR